jgi:two-component system response regulator AtoC
MAKILIVEDDRSLAELLCMHLEDRGYEVDWAGTMEAGCKLFREDNFDAVLLDYQLPDGNGIDWLKQFKDRGREAPVIMITGISDTSVAIESIKLGAYDFIRKPMDETELDTTLGNALAAYRLSRKVETITASDRYRVSIDNIVGQSRAIIEVCKTIGKVAPTDATVLITGETGTGKEVVARAIHHHSARPGLFLPINCSALVETLLESELFGHEKGSFTGAIERKQGRFEVANDGTLFLDEIGEMSPSLQAKLLRVLQEHRFERVGGTQSIQTSARVIAATNRDLARMVEGKAFRDDLYYRLNVVTLHLPPLRERLDDLPLLIEYLLHKINRDLHKAVARIAPDAWKALKGYPWPGNIRELENVLTRAVVLARSELLTADLLGISLDQTIEKMQPAAMDEGTDSEPELITLDQIEERHVRAILAYTRWHKGRACEILGISRPALERKIIKYNIQ